MRIEERRNLIASALTDWPVERRARVHLCFMGRTICALLVDPVFGFVTGFAYCHPLERFNVRTGCLLALARLRISYAYQEFSSKSRVWMPEVGQEYFVPGFEANKDVVKDKDFIPASKRVWKASFMDYMYLSSGMVYRTFADAKRAGRRLLYEGRSIKNIKNACRNFYVAGKLVSGLDKKTDTEGLSLLSDDFNELMESVFADVVNGKKDEESCCENEGCDDSCDCVSDSDFYPDDLIENVDIIAPSVKSGQRCYMDPVTGELYCAD